MPDAAANLDLHFYVAHFPPTGDRPDEGMAKAVDGLASAAARAGAHVTIVCDGNQTTRTRTDRSFDVACFANDDLRRYIDGLNDETLFVLNAMFHLGVNRVARMLNEKGIGYVAAPHDPYSPAIFKRRRHLKLPYWYLRERPMLRRARAVQVLDERHGQFLRDLGVQTPVIVTSNSFAPEDVCPGDALKWRSDGPPRLIFLGRLDAFNKGLDLLIEAYTAIRKTSGAILTIQGPDGGDRQQLEALAGASGVRFSGPDYQKRPWQIVGEHDVLCLPSRFEGFGLAALEAMLAGRVLLVPEIAGIAPHVRASGCGVVVDPQADSIRDGILQLISQRARWKDMGLAGRAYALKHFDWDQIAAKQLRDYAALKLQ